MYSSKGMREERKVVILPDKIRITLTAYALPHLVGSDAASKQLGEAGRDYYQLMA